jgi:hypothetical protein
MDDTLKTFSQTMEQIQESQNHLNIKKKLAPKDFMQQERDWKVELT